MHSKRLLILLFALFHVYNCYSQNQSSLIGNSYFLRGSVNSIGDTNSVSLPIIEIEFETSTSGKCITVFPIGSGIGLPVHLVGEGLGENYLIIDYILTDDSLTLYFYGSKDLVFQLTQAKSKNGFYLTDDENSTFYFEEIKKIENDCFYLQADTVCLENEFFTVPEYSGSLYRYIDKRVSDFFIRDSSYLVGIAFVLRKDGTIDSLRIEIDDTEIKDRLTSIILSSQNKWKESYWTSRIRTKSDAYIHFPVLIKSKYSHSLKRFDIHNHMRKLYNIGLKNVEQNNIDEAIKRFDDCIKIYISYSICNFYSGSINFRAVSIIEEIWIYATFNLAALYFEKGELQKACELWYSIAYSDDEAYSLYDKYCSE